MLIEQQTHEEEGLRDVREGRSGPVEELVLVLGGGREGGEENLKKEGDGQNHPARYLGQYVELTAGEWVVERPVGAHEEPSSNAVGEQRNSESHEQRPKINQVRRQARDVCGAVDATDANFSNVLKRKLEDDWGLEHDVVHDCAGAERSEIVRIFKEGRAKTNGASQTNWVGGWVRLV